MITNQFTVTAQNFLGQTMLPNPSFDFVLWR